MLGLGTEEEVLPREALFQLLQMSAYALARLAQRAGTQAGLAADLHAVPGEAGQVGQGH